MELANLMFVSGLALLWAFFVFVYRPYRVDYMRHQLFSLGRKLFAVVDASGEVSFDNAAFVELRSIVNGMIRFSHSVTFLQWLMLSFTREDESSMRYHKELEKHIDDLPEPIRSKFRNAQDIIAFTLIDHVVHTSIFLAWLVPVKYLILVVMKTAEWLSAHGRGAVLVKWFGIKRAYEWWSHVRSMFSELNGFVALEKQARDSSRACTSH